MKRKPLTATAFAKLCGVTPQTVSNWAAAGMPCVTARRRGAKVSIDLQKALPWVVARRDQPGSERQRLQRVQADRIDMENKLRAGELCEVVAVEEELARIVKRFTVTIELLPDYLEQRCAATPEQLDMIESALDGLRNDLAEAIAGKKAPEEKTDEKTDTD